MLESILPKRRGAFIFPGLKKTPNQIVVARFKDDAGSRWELDEDLNLIPRRPPSSDSVSNK